MCWHLCVNGTMDLRELVSLFKGDLPLLECLLQRRWGGRACSGSRVEYICFLGAGGLLWRLEWYIYSVKKAVIDHKTRSLTIVIGICGLLCITRGDSRRKTNLWFLVDELLEAIWVTAKPYHVMNVRFVDAQMVVCGSAFSLRGSIRASVEIFLRITGWMACLTPSSTIFAITVVIFNFELFFRPYKLVGSSADCQAKTHQTLFRKKHNSTSMLL